MPYLMLIGNVLVGNVYNTLRKQYGDKAKQPNVYVFSAVWMLFSALTLLASNAFKFDFSSDILIWSVGYAVGFLMYSVGVSQAMLYGPLSLTMFFAFFSMIIPTFSGAIFLDQSLSLLCVIGLVMFFLSVIMMNIKSDSEEGLKINFKWAVYVAMAFVGNGASQSIQNIFVNRSGGEHSTEFMVVGSFIACAVIFVAGMFGKENKKIMFRECTVYGSFTGIAHGLSMCCIMYAMTRLPSAILYPTCAAANLIVMFFISRYAYKEKFSKLQLAGYALGIIAVVFLNI